VQRFREVLAEEEYPVESVAAGSAST
jgi:hypothetical protein